MAHRYKRADLVWQPGDLSSTALAYLNGVLLSWEGTPYQTAQQCKGAGVDCVRFVCGVLDELYGLKTDITTLPRDAQMHNAAEAMKVARLIKALYEPNKLVQDNVIEPGDVIVVGPAEGGPGHTLIVGPQKNTVWQVNSWAVCRTGMSFLLADQRRFFVLRCQTRDKWGTHASS